MPQSVRAKIIERRTYLRPINKQGTEFETPLEAWMRVINHQRWLWERAKGGPLDMVEESELEELAQLFINRKATVSGRTRWLGGTSISMEREASQFNCAFQHSQTVYDVVDSIWLLLQGCGVGFRPMVGVLNGFSKPIKELELIRSKKVIKKDKNGNNISDPALKGHPDNIETYDKETGVWKIVVGDSTEAWAKFFGKLLAFKKPVTKLIIDLSEIRPSGYRLSGYGWISSGDGQISLAIEGIFEVLNRSAGRLLNAIDIVDIENHLGTILSSRRSAEIALYEYEGQEWEDFALAKRNYFCYFVSSEIADLYDDELTLIEEGRFEKGTALIAVSENGKDVITEDYEGRKYVKVLDESFMPCGYVSLSQAKKDRNHRGMSNNSLLFYHKPTVEELTGVFDIMQLGGGSEPGFINAVEATRRAPYFRGVNPCAEILLGDKSFCNLVETALSRFNGDLQGLLRAHYLVARANYRQTCVNLDDGILQRTWHELNEFLRLCGVGVTAVIGWEHSGSSKHWRDLADSARDGANSMADELGLPRPKLVTTVKPSGTQTKVFGKKGDELGEGIHKPLGRFIFNNVKFSAEDPIVSIMKEANYHIIVDPNDSSARIIRFPVEYASMEFDKITKTIKGEEVEVEVNLESAIDQLERYKLLMENYVDHNCSITVSYDPSEIPAMVDWLLDNWDTYVGVSFIYRNDPTKTALDLGYPYLPQEVVDEKTFRDYEATLKDVNLGDSGEGILDMEDCATGACPVR